MKHLLLSLIIVLFLVSTTFAKQELIQKTIDGKYANVIKITLDNEHTIIVNAVESGKTPKSLKTLMDEVGGISAINGGFFCPAEKAYSRCPGNTTETVRVMNGNLLSKWGEDIGQNRAFFGFTVDGTAKLIDNMTRVWSNNTASGGTVGWRNTGFLDITNGLNMPVLLKEGKNVTYSNDEMNKNPKQGKVANKTFICSQKDKKTIYMGFIDGQNFISLADFIKKNFNCHDAILLDNGGTKAMAYNKKMFFSGRRMMDALIVVPARSAKQKTVADQKKRIARINQSDPALAEALLWFGNYGFSKERTIAKFNPNEYVTNEQFVKFIGKFSNHIGKDVSRNPACRNIAKPFAGEFAYFIQVACRLGIVSPTQPFDAAKRIRRGDLYETFIHLLYGDDPQMVTLFTQDKKNLNGYITRGEAALFLYELYKYFEKQKEAIFPSTEYSSFIWEQRSNGIVYKDTKLGFTITFPTTRTGVSVHRRFAVCGEKYGYPCYMIGFSQQKKIDKHIGFGVFTIKVVAQENLQKIANICKNKTCLGKAPDYSDQTNVYFIEKVPYSQVSDFFTTEQEYLEDIGRIKKTFASFVSSE